MRLQKISVSFSHYSDANLKAKADFILQSMTGNAAFVAPIPTLADLQTAITNFGDALTTASTLDRNAVAQKNQCREILEGILSQLGMYVMFIANGDVAILISSGYTLTKVPQPGSVTAPEGIVIKNGPSTGQLTTVVPTQKAASSFLHSVTTDSVTADSKWISLSSRTGKCTFTDLQPGLKYWGKTAAVASDGEMFYSPLGSWIVQ